MAAWVTPSPASCAINCDSWTGSGVVSAPSTTRFGDTTPVVPMEAAARPVRSQICRVKVAMEVLPAVPVTATTWSGCAP